MDKLQLYFSETIEIDDIGTLYQPTIDEIVKPGFGEQKYNDLIEPFITSTDMFDINEQYKGVIKNFDLFFMRDKDGGKILKHSNKKDMLEVLIESLKFYFKVDEIKVDEHYMSILVGYTGLIHRNNYDMLSDLILEINNVKRPEVEKVPEFKSERQRDVYTKLMAGRRRNQQKNNLNLISIANMVMHGGKSFIPYNEVRNFTISQLYNSYSAIVQVDYSNKEFDKYLAGADPKDLDLTYITERLKI
jgi:hypothetical protein